MSFKIYRQFDSMDCGPACLKMILKHYGKDVSLERLKELAQVTMSGVSLFGLSETAEKLGFRTISAKLTFEQLLEDAPLPCILHWDQNHYVVLTPSSKPTKLIVADPCRRISEVY